MPAGYSSWQVNDKIWLGMAVNAPFGLGVHFPQVNVASSGGSANSAKVDTYNFSPTIAYKINDRVSVAVGLQAQYLKASYDIYLGAAPLIGSLNGGGWSYGWTAGVARAPPPRRPSWDYKNDPSDSDPAWPAWHGRRRGGSRLLAVS